MGKCFPCSSLLLPNHLFPSSLKYLALNLTLSNATGHSPSLFESSNNPQGVPSYFHTDFHICNVWPFCFSTSSLPRISSCTIHSRGRTLQTLHQRSQSCSSPCSFFSSYSSPGSSVILPPFHYSSLLY